MYSLYVFSIPLLLSIFPVGSTVCDTDTDHVCTVPSALSCAKSVVNSSGPLAPLRLGTDGAAHTATLQLPLL